MKPQTPLVAVDILIRMADRKGSSIVLIERRHPPYGWALPGGFVDVGERLEKAAIREAQEETQLKVNLICLLGCYSDPRRDPRGHAISVVYIADAEGCPEAKDDAKNIGLFDLDHLPSLVFDHNLIMKDYRHWLQTGEVAPLRFD
ncbi:MAG: NUDIX hydrolase [Bdellovibrio sp.]|nr:MAG: NUDIX hydrolase [Bdellovibrio sp.]